MVELPVSSASACVPLLRDNRSQHNRFPTINRTLELAPVLPNAPDVPCGSVGDGFGPAAAAYDGRLLIRRSARSADHDSQPQFRTVFTVPNCSSSRRLGLI
jgi:hypothetical protein